MRTLQTAAFVVVVCGFFASQASATPLGQLDYEGESSAQAATAGSDHYQCYRFWHTAFLSLRYCWTLARSHQGSVLLYI